MFRTLEEVWASSMAHRPWLTLSLAVNEELLDTGMNLRIDAADDEYLRSLASRDFSDNEELIARLKRTTRFDGPLDIVVMDYREYFKTKKVDISVKGMRGYKELYGRIQTDEFWQKNGTLMKDYQAGGWVLVLAPFRKDLGYRDLTTCHAMGTIPYATYF